MFFKTNRVSQDGELRRKNPRKNPEPETRFVLKKPGARNPVFWVSQDSCDRIKKISSRPGRES
ncbi:MAG: hypothetical protein F6J93_27325 [Oscillatoria sp. SIO1A7]|nr:hypothetical protein [Oscillatoria sp. SIO1A7]